MVARWSGAFAVLFALAPARAAPAADTPSIDAPSESERRVVERTVRVEPPRAVATPPPLYPEGATGDTTVVVELTVDREGNVRDARVVRGSEPFAAAALSAVASWRFVPAQRGGLAVAARIRFELAFHEPRVVAPATETGKTPTSSGSERAVDAEPPPATEILVRGVRPEAPHTSLTRAEVREIPGTFGDPFRAIEVIPGVTPIITGVPYFFVRGAPPGNVGYFLDGIRVPQLYHFALGPSVIHPGLVERVDLYAGGYPARYGRFSGGIVAAETKAPEPRFHGEGNVRLFDAGALLEAPFADGRGSVLVGGRYSYTMGILSLVAPEVTLGYWDYQLRGSYDVGSRDTLGVFAFGSYDLLQVESAGGTGASAQFHRVDLRWDRRLDGDTRFRTALTLGHDRTGTEVTSDTDVAATVQSLAARFELEHRASPRALVRAGADVVFDDASVFIAQERSQDDVENDDDDELRLHFPTRLELGVGLRGDVVWEPEPGVTVTPGLRLDLFRSGRAMAFGVDPRISARFGVSSRVSLEHAFGIVHQPPSFLVSIPGFSLAGLDDGLQKSAQASSGVEVKLGAEWTSKLTLFQNAFFEFTDLLSMVRYGEDLPDIDPGTRSLGHAYGLELMLRRPLTRKFGGLLSYTLSRSERSTHRKHYVASFDRTHVLHAAAAYDLGRRWRMGSRFTLYTGTPASIEREGGIAVAPSVDGEVPVASEAAAPLGERRRAPPFYRLDVRLEKRWLIGRSGAWLSFIFEVLNTTLSREVVDYRCYGPNPADCEEEAIGPVTIPSIGIEAAF